MLKESDRWGARVICDVLVHPLQVQNKAIPQQNCPCDNRQETLLDHSCGDSDRLFHVTTGDRVELIREIRHQYAL